MCIITTFEYVFRGKIQKGKITSWLLNVALVLSLFAFSGLSAAPSTTQRTSISELVTTGRASSTRIVSFKSVCIKLSLTLYQKVVNFLQAIIHYTQSVKIFFRQNPKEHIACTLTQFLALSQRIPFNTFEDSFIFRKG